MSNVIHVNAYLRRKDPPAAYIETTERLLPYDLGDMLIGALERELPKLLPDCKRDVIERMEQTY